MLLCYIIFNYSINVSDDIIKKVKILLRLKRKLSIVLVQVTMLLLVVAVFSRIQAEVIQNVVYVKTVNCDFTHNLSKWIEAGVFQPNKQICICETEEYM